MGKKITLTYTLINLTGATRPVNTKAVIRGNQLAMTQDNPKSLETIYQGMKAQGHNVTLKNGIILQTYSKEKTATEIAEQIEYELNVMRKKMGRYIAIKNFNKTEEEEGEEGFITA